MYLIAILDFEFDEDQGQPEKYQYKVKLSDIETNKVFYDKLTFIYLTMPKFKKTIAELQTHFDKWLFVLKNLHKLDRIPAELREHIFLKLFEIAEIAKFNPEEYIQYEESLKFYRDLKNSLDTAKEEGREEGFKAGEMTKQIQIAKDMKKDGFPVDAIIKYTGLTKTEIESL